MKTIRGCGERNTWMHMEKPWSLIKFGLAAFMLTFGVGMQRANAQDLVLNGEFHQNVGTWENPDLPAATWSSLDANGSAVSGSAQLLNNSSVANTRLYVLRQCLVPSQGGLYRVEVAGLVSSQSATGRLVVSRIDRPSTACSGGQSGSGGYFIEANGLWQRTQFELQNSVAAGSSIELLIGIEKDAAGGMFIAHVDDVRLVAMPLFASGFE